MIDLRYYNGRLGDLIQEQEITDVLVLYQIPGFLKDRNISKLVWGKKQPPHLFQTVWKSGPFHRLLCCHGHPAQLLAIQRIDQITENIPSPTGASTGPSSCSSFSMAEKSSPWSPRKEKALPIPGLYKVPDASKHLDLWQLRRRLIPVQTAVSISIIQKCHRILEPHLIIRRSHDGGDQLHPVFFSLWPTDSIWQCWWNRS